MPLLYLGPMPSYHSRTYYTGDNSETDFLVGFDYLDQDHVKVYVDDVLTTAWSWASSTMIRFDTAPASNTDILIKRETSRTTRLVDYTAPSSLNENDLDQDSLQAFYIGQEALDDAALGLPFDPSDDAYKAGSKQIKEVATPTASTDAANKSYVDTAVSTVEAAVQADADAAAASATAAATSATASATSAGASATSAAEAAASEARAALYADALQNPDWGYIVDPVSDTTDFGSIA